LRTEVNVQAQASSPADRVAPGRAGVGQGGLADHLTGGIKNADVMLPVTEIKAEGEPTADGSGRREYDRRRRTGFSSSGFHRQTLAPTHPRVGSLPSHLILLNGIVI